MNQYNVKALSEFIHSKPYGVIDTNAIVIKEFHNREDAKQYANKINEYHAKERGKG